jgi:hypothetical protein
MATAFKNVVKAKATTRDAHKASLVAHNRALTVKEQLAEDERLAREDEEREAEVKRKYEAEHGEGTYQSWVVDTSKTTFAKATYGDRLHTVGGRGLITKSTHDAVTRALDVLVYAHGRQIEKTVAAAEDRADALSVAQTVRTLRVDIGPRAGHTHYALGAADFETLYVAKTHDEAYQAMVYGKMEFEKIVPVAFLLSRQLIVHAASLPRIGAETPMMKANGQSSTARNFTRVIIDNASSWSEDELDCVYKSCIGYPRPVKAPPVQYILLG